MKLNRIQLSRRKGWRMPPNTLKADRSTRWGNPYRVGDVGYSGILLKTKSMAAQEFGKLLEREPERVNAFYQEVKRRGITGVACWCKLEDECHCDYYIRAGV